MEISQRSEIDEQLRLFLNDMVSGVVNKFGDEIVSIALFGSATTKEWIRGKSDIDFIVVVKHRNLKKDIENYLNRLILELDKKHDLQLVRTCSTYTRGLNPFANILYRIESALLFGQPFFILSLDQIDFEKGIIADSRIRFVTSIFDSLSIFVAKMRQTGVVIYGKDLIRKLAFSPSTFDKIRTAFAPLWIIVMSLFSFPVDEMFSLNHSIKATIWACEDVLFAFNMPLSSTTEELGSLERIFNRYEKVDFSHAKKTVLLKSKLVSRREVSKGFVAKHILQTILFVLTLYHSASQLARTKPNMQATRRL